MQYREPGLLKLSELFIQVHNSFSENYLFTISDAGIFRCNTHYNIQRQSYRDFLMMYIVHGKIAFEIEDCSFQAKKGQLILLDCTKKHSYRSVVESEFYWFHFKGPATKAYYQKICKETHLFEIMSESEIILDFTSIISGIRQSSMDEHQQSIKLHNLLYNLLRKADMQAFTELHSMELAIQFMKSHLAEDISLDTLAKKMNLSPYYFSRKFKQYSGYSPYAYLILLRLSYAEHLLLNSQKTINEISLECGFSTPGHFITTFKKQHKSTPLNYRKKHIY